MLIGVMPFCPDEQIFYHPSVCSVSILTTDILFLIFLGLKDRIIDVKIKILFENTEINVKPLDNIFLGNLSLAFSFSASSFEGFSSFSNDCVNWI